MAAAWRYKPPLALTHAGKSVPFSALDRRTGGLFFPTPIPREPQTSPVLSEPRALPFPHRRGGLFSSSRLHEAFPETGGKRDTPEEHGNPLSRRVCA